MDCVAEKPIPNLRRHSTSPGSAGRAILASVSGGRSIKKPSASSHSSMKSNPYVGWFRHSPSTEPRFQKNSPWCKVPSSLEACKNSPHIGWFRHAPPSSLKLQPSQAPLPLVISDKEKDLLWKILQELSTDKPPKFANPNTQRLIISGHLRGGGRKYMERSRRHSSGSKPFVRDLTDSSAEGTLSTVNALSRLASWFLFPVAHDAESSGYRTENYPKKPSKKKASQNEDGLLGQLLSPYLPTFLEEPPRDVPKDVYARYGARVGGNESGSDLDSDESSSSDSSSASSQEQHQNQPSPSRTKDLSLSVSSLAEAYYAHQRTTTEYGAESDRLAPSLSAPGPVSPHRLDYVITQMDIARMSRNASRHLDVQSILELPVITYKKGVKARTAAAKSKLDQAGWSWTIVEESEGESDEALSTAQGEVDFCVICLEHFVDGDRLRVLPCDHSFHVGCIDRWLSGSQSFEECYTSGCPTCKKRPTIEDHDHHNNARKPRAQSLCEGTSNIREGKNRSASLDGSVPSWAFAQIGSALVAQQDQGISICPGASYSEGK